MDDNPLVSVIITTYNRPVLLERAIISVLNQSYSNIEIIISDDNSTYDTRQQVIELSNQFNQVIIYRKNSKNMGACYTRNEGIKIANGYFIAGLDDDDEFGINRISNLVNNYDDKYSLITSNTKVITKKSSFPLFSVNKNEIITLNSYLWENIIGTQCLVRKDRILSCAGFDVNLSSAQDADMWLRLIEKFGPAYRLKECDYILHIEHDNPRITTSKSKIQGMIDFNNKHYYKMSKSQRLYGDFKVKLWENNNKIRFSQLMSLDINCYFFIAKKLITTKLRQWFVKS